MTTTNEIADKIAGEHGQSDTGARSSNPSTGATIKVAAAKKLSFQPSKALKDAMNK